MQEGQDGLWLIRYKDDKPILNGFKSEMCEKFNCMLE